jgi:2-keto-4-pentenoate hydratase
MDARVRRGMEAQLARWRSALAGGAARVGWKVGLNDPRVQAHLGIDGCVVGHLTLATTLVPGEPHSLRGGTRVGAECEVAIHLGRDLDAGASDADAAAAVLGLGAALELIDLDRPLDDLEGIVAANVFHRAVLLGPTRPGASIDGVRAQVLRHGAVVETVDAAAATGPVTVVVRSIADALGACGEHLRAGDRVIAGSLAGILWLEPGDVVGLDLGPLGALSLAVTA